MSQYGQPFVCPGRIEYTERVLFLAAMSDVSRRLCNRDEEGDLLTCLGHFRTSHTQNSLCVQRRIPVERTERSGNVRFIPSLLTLWYTLTAYA